MTEAEHDTLLKAIKRAGGRSKLAALLGVTHSAVSKWERGPGIPPRHVLKVEDLTGISRYKLRPDIYGQRAPK